MSLAMSLHKHDFILVVGYSSIYFPALHVPGDSLAGQTHSLPPSGQRDYPGDVFLLNLCFTINICLKTLSWCIHYTVLSLGPRPSPLCLKCAYCGEGRGLRLHCPPCIHSCAYTMPCRGSQGHQASRRDKGDVHSFTDHI